MRGSRLLAVVAVLVLLFGAAPAAQASQRAGVRFDRIAMDDGVEISAAVITPTNSRRAAPDGTLPLLVAAASWGLNDLEYVGAAERFAREAGYLVISYTPRGFWESGGEAQIAGSRDVADQRAVIDAAVARYGADPSRIGAFGVSYGAGIALLTAEADPRIRAVGSLSGWSDLRASLLPGDTLNEQGAALLLGLGAVTARPGAELRAAQRAFLDDDFDPLLPLLPERSPISGVSALNAHGTAVYLGHAYTDGLFPPGQMVELFQGLTSPKRLDLTPGDHAVNQIAGAIGIGQRQWRELRRWFDRYVLGDDNGVDREPPVRLAAANAPDVVSASSWPEVATRAERNDLPSASLLAGLPTLAESGTLLISGALQGFLSIPPVVVPATLSPATAASWAMDPLPERALVAGSPQLRMTVSTSGELSLFAYLYDVDELGVGSLVTHAPLSVRGSGAVSMPLQTVLWRLEAGHHLQLVVDTMDARYRSRSTLGSPVQLSNVSLDVPFR